MAKIISRFLTILTVFLVLIEGVGTPLVIRAEEGVTTEIEIQIDDSIGTVTADFDSIDRFNEFGIAIIGKDYVGSNQTITRKYGLINKLGEIVIEPIYYMITAYNKDFYSVVKYENSQMADGLASVKTGELIIPVEYNYFDYLDKNGLFNFTRIVNLNNQTSYKSEVYSYYNGNLNPIDLPSEYAELKITQMSSRSIYQDVFQINASFEYVDDYGGLSYKQGQWLAGSNGEIILNIGNKSISWNQMLNGSYYFITYYNDLATNMNSAGLYRISLINGEPVLSVLLDPSEYRNIWYDGTENIVSAVKVAANGNWISSYYHLENGWVLGDEWGTYQTKDIFVGDNELYLVDTCEVLSEGYTDCEKHLSKREVPNVNILGNKTYDDISQTQFSNYFLLTNYSKSTSNILVKRDDQYFLLFEEDIQGIGYVNENRFAQFDNLLVDLNNIEFTIPVNDERVHRVINGYSIYSFQRFLAVMSGDVNFFSLYDYSVNKTLLANVKMLSLNEVSNGYLTGKYVRNVEGVDINFVFAYDLATNIMTQDIEAYEIGVFNEFGYAPIADINNIGGMLYKDGTIAVPFEDENIDGLSAFQVYDKDLVTALSISDRRIYLLNNGQAQKFDGLSSIILSQDAPTYFDLNDSSQHYILDTSLIDTSAYSKIGAFVNGKAYVKKNDFFYVLNSSDLSESKVEGISDFVGSIIQTSENGIIYRDLSSNPDIPLDIDSISNLTQITEYVYQYIDAFEDISIIFFDTSNKEIKQINGVVALEINQHDAGSLLVSSLEDGILTAYYIGKNGELIDSVNDGGYQFLESFIIRHNQDGSNDLIMNDGTPYLDQNSKLVSSSSLKLKWDGFIEKSDLEGTELIKVVGSSAFNYGNISLNSGSIYGQFYEVTANCIDPVSGEVFNGLGLIDKTGKMILDPNKCYVSYTINTEYKLISTQKQVVDAFVSVSEGSGFFNFNGEEIVGLSNYKPEFGLNVNVQGDLIVKRFNGLMTKYTETDENGTVEIFERNYDYNTYNLLSETFLYNKDYTHNIGLQFDKLYNLRRIQDVKLVEDMTEKDLNVFDLNSYYNIRGEEVKVRYQRDYYDLDDNLIFDSGECDYVEFDGRYIKAYYTSILTNLNSMRLIDTSGNIVFGDYGYIQYIPELNFYFASLSKEVTNPANPEFSIPMEVMHVFDASTNTRYPYVFSRIDFNKLIRDSVVPVSVYLDYTTLDDLEYGAQTRSGVLNASGEFLAEPIYNWVDDFNDSGNASIYLDTGPQDCSYEDQNGVIHEQTCSKRKEGLVNKERGLIVEPLYDSIELTNALRSNWSQSVFDINGHVRIVNYGVYDRLIGLADVTGPLFEGAVYSNAYYKNGYYYLKKQGENWKIINGSDFTDIRIVDVPLLENGASVTNIEVTGPFIIAKQSIYDPEINRSYDYFGVLNQDMSIFLEFDYSGIRFEENKFYLEKYNVSTGTTQEAIMDVTKNFIIPFSNKYDALGEYVDGYAIGQSGTKEISPTSADPVVKLLSVFFEQVSALENDFVLEVIDESGKVVSDLSSEFESVTLLGTVDGVMRAMVKKDGQYYFASVIENVVPLNPITEISINLQDLDLEVNETYQLIGTILPIDTNEPKRVEWSSSNPDVVSVDSSGLITALRNGSAEITYKVNDFVAKTLIIVASNLQLTGKILYYSGEKPIQNVSISLIGKDGFSVLSNLTGDYQFDSLNRETYQINLSKVDDVKSISAFDASIVLRYSVGLETLTDNQKVAADVTMNNSISALDASQILQKTVGIIPGAYPDSGKLWIFKEDGLIINLEESRLEFNMTGILLGDVSGDWSP